MPGQLQAVGDARDVPHSSLQGWEAAKARSQYPSQGCEPLAWWAPASGALSTKDADKHPTKCCSGLATVSICSPKPLGELRPGSRAGLWRWGFCYVPFSACESPEVFPAQSIEKILLNIPSAVDM